MSEPSTSPIPYRVVYSEWVRNQLRSHITKARDRGLGPQVLAAMKELDRLLHLYPQFGQPLRDLELKPAQLWIGVVAPLVAHYVLDEERRLVGVGFTHLMLPKSGLQT
jgi:hypothetical protein